MSNSKEWQQYYGEKNPFALARAIRQGIRKNRKTIEENFQGQVKYLWVYLDQNGRQYGGNSKRLDTQAWLGVIDECAATGVHYVILGVGEKEKLSEHPEVFAITEWATQIHEMQVGIHLCHHPICRESADRLVNLQTDKVCLFANKECFDAMRFVEDLGLRLYQAEGQQQDYVYPDCDLPREMTCIGSDGHLYTCGLVLGKEEFHLGTIQSDQISAVMQNESLPHIIPEGLPKAHPCCGCPPLMVQRMRGEEPHR